jgi:mutator protein MutT
MKRGIDYIGVGVGACIVNDQGQIFLALRGQKAKNEKGKWEIPGGSVEFGETLENALKREIFEELGIEIEIVKLLDVCDHILKDEGQHWVSPTYICKITKGIPTVKEPEKCDGIGWFSIDDAKKLSLSVITQHDVEKIQGLALK